MAEKKTKPQTRPLSVMSAILGECMCADPLIRASERFRGPSAQFLSLTGVECISLGAVTNESNSRERVDSTVQQLATKPQRLASIGYLVDGDIDGQPAKVTDAIPLDIWEKAYPNDKTMARQIKKLIQIIKSRDYQAALQDFEATFKNQCAHPNRNDNKLFAGITLHSICVIHILMGNSDKALPLLKKAVELKKAGFGEEHPEVGISLQELGIQLFAQGQCEEALLAFHDAQKMMVKAYGSDHPKVAMVLNNIACCNFQQGNSLAGLVTFQQARDMQMVAMRSNAKADLDLLHVATTLGNLGYMMIRLKQYEEARGIFEDALLIQQSVLGDNHKAVEDTKSNIDFTNAFHS